jgi:hypothetical protein
MGHALSANVAANVCTGDASWARAIPLSVDTSDNRSKAALIAGARLFGV